MYVRTYVCVHVIINASCVCAETSAAGKDHWLVYHRLQKHKDRYLQEDGSCNYGEFTASSNITKGTHAFIIFLIFSYNQFFPFWKTCIV